LAHRTYYCSARWHSALQSRTRSGLIMEANVSKRKSRVLLLSSALAFAAPAGVNAQQLPDSSGHVGPEAGAHSFALAPTASPATACLQLHLGSTVFNFNVNINADVYPYPITGGTITGNICQAPWQVTAGSLGNALTIHGQRTPVAGCASTISVVGNFDNPSSYIGTYGFNGSSTSFSHHTLFLGYDRPSCP
jgi:hypothetical protein